MVCHCLSTFFQLDPLYMRFISTQIAQPICNLTRIPYLRFLSCCPGYAVGKPSDGLFLVQRSGIVSTSLLTLTSPARPTLSGHLSAPGQNWTHSRLPPPPPPASSSSCGLSGDGRCRSHERAPCLSILR